MDTMYANNALRDIIGKQAHTQLKVIAQDAILTCQCVIFVLVKTGVLTAELLLYFCLIEADAKNLFKTAMLIRQIISCKMYRELVNNLHAHNVKLDTLKIQMENVPSAKLQTANHAIQQQDATHVKLVIFLHLIRHNVFYLLLIVVRTPLYTLSTIYQIHGYVPNVKTDSLGIGPIYYKVVALYVHPQ